MLAIQGRIYIELKIDNKPMTASASLIDRITMTEGGGALSPALEIIFNDFSGTLNRELALTDGNEILITVGKTPDDVKTISRQYRLFGTRQITSANGPRIQAVAIYDAPGYLTGSIRESFKGTTGDVLQKIAERCKLDYDGPEKVNGKKPDDSQVWRNVCKSRAMFVQEITRHAYIDDTSTMVTMLTSLGRLRYRNLSDVIEIPSDQIKRMFVHNVDQEKVAGGVVKYTVSEARSRSTAGLMNAWQNYGSTRVENTLEGNSTIHDKVDVKTASQYLAINDTVKKTVERSRIEYTPLDSGNTHKNYQKAMYQNLKLMGLFSEYVSLVTEDVTDVEPLDAVLYRQANSDPKEPLSISDVYIVIAKTVFVKGGANYAERIELVRRSLPNKGGTELSSATSTAGGSSATPAQAAASAAPDSVIDPTSNVTKASLPAAMTLTTLAGPTQGSFDQIKASLPDLRKATGFALPSLQGMNAIVSQARAGVSLTPHQTTTLVSQLRGSIASLRHYTTVAKSFAGQVTTSAAQLKSLGDALKAKNVSMALRSAIMFQRSGIMNSYTATLGGVKQQMQMATITRSLANNLKPLRDAIDQVAQGREAHREFESLCNEIDSSSSICRTQSTSLWNNSISILNDRPMPHTSTIRPINEERITYVMSNLYRPAPSGSYPSVPLNTATADMTKVLMHKGGDRALPWIKSDAAWQHDEGMRLAMERHTVMVRSSNDPNIEQDYRLTPEAASLTLQQMERESSLAEQRERDMYDTNW